MNAPLILHAPPSGEGTPLPLGLAGYPTVIEHKPVHYRRKEIIRAGDWVHRGDRKPFSVSRDRMDAWTAAFNRRLANGIKPYVPDHHTEEPKAGENFGYVVGLTREGDSLYADLQLIGDEALALAAKNDVSVYVKAEGIDAKGSAYGEHLHHLALTPNPNQPYLGPFVTIAASAGATPVEAPVFELSTSGAEPERSPIMKPETITKLRAKLNLPDAAAVPDEEVAERAAALALTDPPADKTAEVTALSADKARLETELATAKQEREQATLALSAAQPREPDPMSLSLINRAFKTEREQVIASGVISEAGMTELDALLGVGNSKGVALSLSAGGTDPLYIRVCDILRRHPGVKTNNGVERATSALKLSGDSSEEMSDERREYVARSMGIPVPKPTQVKSA